MGFDPKSFYKDPANDTSTLGTILKLAVNEAMVGTYVGSREVGFPSKDAGREGQLDMVTHLDFIGVQTSTDGGNTWTAKDPLQKFTIRASKTGTGKLNKKFEELSIGPGWYVGITFKGLSPFKDRTTGAARMANDYEVRANPKDVDPDFAEKLAAHKSAGINASVVPEPEAPAVAASAINTAPKRDPFASVFPAKKAEDSAPFLSPETMIEKISLKLASEHGCASPEEVKAKAQELTGFAWLGENQTQLEKICKALGIAA